MLARDGGDVTVKFHELDISQKGSIEVFRDMLVREHPEGVDAVVNNAGEFDFLLSRDHGKEKQREHRKRRNDTPQHADPPTHQASPYKASTSTLSAPPSKPTTTAPCTPHNSSSHSCARTAAS